MIVDGWNESNEDNILTKDLDPFFLLKMLFVLISFSAFFLMHLDFFLLRSISSEVAIRDAGKSHESRWNLNEDSNLEVKLEGGSKDDKEDLIEEDSLFLRGGNVLWRSGAFDGLLWV